MFAPDPLANPVFLLSSRLILCISQGKLQTLCHADFPTKQSISPTSTLLNRGHFIDSNCCRGIYEETMKKHGSGQITDFLNWK